MAKLKQLHGSDLLPTTFPMLSPMLLVPQYNVDLFNALSIACQAQLHRFNTQV